MKKKILIVGPYLPGKAFGGPVKSLVNITETLSNKYNFYVVTNDRDLNSNTPYENIKVDGWNQIGKAKVYYIPKRNSSEKIINLLKKNEYDLIYLNSFFSKHSIIIQFIKLVGLIKAPLLIAPRGEFSPGALNIKSFKKRAYLFIYNFFKMSKKVVYTSNLDIDKGYIHNILGSKTNVITANNIVVKDGINKAKKPYKKKGELKIVTVSRVVKIKNLAYSLNILKEIDENNKNVECIIFDIYGPIEDVEYWEIFKELIENLSGKIEVNYKGSLEYGEVIDILSAYHLFLLPTQGENFGHVIQEALLAACPVIISDQTPWRGLKEKQVGYDISLSNAEGFTNAINGLLDMSNEDYTLLSQSAYKFGMRQIEDQKSIEDHKSMFEKVMEKKDEINV